MAFAAVFAALTVVAERQPYERYRTIVDRQMFGQPPPGFDPSKMPSEVAKTKDAEVAKKEEAVKKSIRFSVINVTSAGETVVGFSDNGDPKNALHYYLKVGESQNGWTVKAADPDEATMTIEKEGIEVTLKLGGDSATSQDAVKSVASSSREGALALSASGSLRERRRQREAAEESARNEREERRDKVQSELLSELQKLKEEQRQAREDAERREREAAEAAEKKAAEEAKTSEENVE